MKHRWIAASFLALSSSALLAAVPAPEVDVTVVVLKDTGHRVLEERPKETTDALVKFL